MTDINQPATVTIHLLGEFKVVLTSDPTAVLKFRSRTAERMLALLALRLGRAVSKTELSDLLWPDSDGDRQAQNIRKAISDLRQVLDGSGSSPSLLSSHSDRIWLEEQLVTTDVGRFKSHTDAGLSGVETESNLRAAIQTYSGPLLPGHDASWIDVHRMELEERFSQSVEQLICILLESDRHDEALRIGRQAVIAAPLREDVHVALMRAYASAGMKTQAIRQFEELETLLSDEWGETPSAASVKAFDTLDTTTGPPSKFNRVALERESTGGAMPARSPFYVVRECDRLFRAAIDRSEGTILINGPRQVGKTSLLGRVLNDLRQNSVRVAVTDFQVLSRSQLANADSLYRTLIFGLATQLGVTVDLKDGWNEWIGPNSNLDAYVGSILSRIEGSVVWAMDEADLLFGSEYVDDFFGLIRGWFNRRAMDEAGPFNRLTIVISYATEAHLFIQDLNQSPFNVGFRIPVCDFDMGETREICLRYGANLTDEETRLLVRVTGGQPFLTRRALDAYVHDGMKLEAIAASASHENGPFGDHLKRLLASVTKDEPTKNEVIRYLTGHPFAEPKTPLRLIAGGMLVRTHEGRYDLRVPCYREFLTRYLIS